ncbi:MAG: glycosyltransferase family 4 protein [bacterium]
MIHPHDVRFDPWTIRILELANRLALRGHTVTLCYVTKRQVEPHEQLVHTDLPNSVKLHPLGFRHSDLARNARLIAGLAQRADVVHIQKCFPSAVVPGLWAAYLSDRPVHYDWDDHETAIAKIVCDQPLVRHEISIWERQLPYLVDTLTYSSEGIRRMALSKGFSEDRMWWAPVGADLDRFSPNLDGTAIRKQNGVNEETSVVLYLGQLEGAAYAELAIRSMEFVHRKFPDAILWVIGGGKGLANLRQMCETLPNADRIRLMDYVKHDQVPQYLAAATVCVASFEENAATLCKSPLKIAEYLAAGKAIVASGVGEVSRMLDSCGIIVQPGDPEALAIGICGFLEDTEFREKYERLARKKAEEVFNWNRIAETLETAYRKALDLRTPIHYA